MLINDRQIIISSAGSRKATLWLPQTLYWSELLEKVSTPVRSTETIADYLGYPKSKQDNLKDVGGFVAGTLEGNKRRAGSVKGRDVITLDLDNIQPGGTKDAILRVESLGCAYAIYSTRKHEEAKPRLRVLIPLDRTVTADEYEPLARKVASLIGIELCDPTTFEASRLMYWPSCCVDSQYVYTYEDNPFINADGILAKYTNWRDINGWPEVPGVKQNHQKLAARQEDPTTKTGVIGAFCKTYDVYKVIESFIPGIYEPCDDNSNRYTYTGGSTVGGAIAYENGNFLYSHHATDPAGGKLCNAFDLVRLHKFGEMDDDAKPDTPVNKLPSYKAMCEFAVSDNFVATIINQERYEKTTEAFSQPVDDGNIANWISKLALSATTGTPLKTIDNIVLILENDPLIKNKIAFDEFANRGIVLGSLPWDSNDTRRDWKEIDDAGLTRYLEKTYGITGEKKIYYAIALCAHEHTFNDIKEYLTNLNWDGIKRLDMLLVDYLGAKDIPYTRAIMRKSLTAAVARAMTPGVKYDYMPILAGPQGIGKSTFLRILGRSWFSDSLQTFEGKEAAELIQGTWVNEIGELNGFNKSETSAVKQFLSKTEDIYREPFGKRTGRYPRRCVFFGTSNESEFLKDRTGNRRFWPVALSEQQPTKSVFNDLEDEVDQIWAEAFLSWQLGEKLYLTGEVEIEAKRQQEIYKESNAKEGIIREFVERPVPLDWSKRSLGERRLYWSGEFERGNVESIERDRICAAEVWCECFGGDIKYIKKTDTREINDILADISGWKKHNSTCRFGCYGIQRGFVKV
jgi:predicted P-loop ATPase